MIIFLYANSICFGGQLRHSFSTISQQTEKTTNRYVTTKFSTSVVVKFSVIFIFQLRIANWPNHPRFGLAECARRVSIRRPLSGHRRARRLSRFLPSSKASAGSAHYAGPAPKVSLGRHQGLKFRIFFDFWSLWSPIFPDFLRSFFD